MTSSHIKWLSVELWVEKACETGCLEPALEQSNNDHTSQSSATKITPKWLRFAGDFPVRRLNLVYGKFVMQ